MRLKNVSFVSLLVVTLLLSSIMLVSARRAEGKPPSGGGGPVLMGRQITVGFEINANTYPSGTHGEQTGDGLTAATGLTGQQTIVRSGNWALKCDSGAASTASIKNTLPSAQTVLYARAYFYFDSLPTSDTAIMSLFDSGGSSLFVLYCRMNSSGQLYLKNAVTGLQIGSSFSDPLQTGKWYRVEMYGKQDPAVGEAELQLDGVSIVSGTGLNLGSVSFGGVSSGWINTSPGTNIVCYIDDLAVNDNSGSFQNSWPGEGHIVLLKPTSDNAVGTGWVDGDGSGTLFGSVDNTPPIGTTTPANGTQIKNLTSTTTGNYDANMDTYTNVGIEETDIITLVQAVCDHAEAIATGTKLGALQIVSNPAQGAEDGFTYGNDSGAMAAWSTDWRMAWGTAQYNPTIDVNAAPVLRVGKRTASTREVDVDFMGIYVEYQINRVVMSPFGLLMGPHPLD